jgi:hypothetical protein
VLQTPHPERYGNGYSTTEKAMLRCLGADFFLAREGDRCRDGHS